MTQRSPIRVLFIDDNSGLLESLRLRVKLEPDLTCVGTLPSAEGLIEEVRCKNPDIVLLDIEMPGPDPFEAAAVLSRDFPTIRTIFLSAYVRDDYINRALQSGAWGYVSKSEDVDVVISSIREAAGGRFIFSPKVRHRCRITERLDR